jgi:hypothetical protein
MHVSGLLTASDGQTGFIGGAAAAEESVDGYFFYDSFENEPDDNGVPQDWEAVTDPSSDGETRTADSEGVFNTNSDTGSQSYYAKESDANGNVIYIRPSEQPLSEKRTSDVSVALERQSSQFEGSGDGFVGVELYEGTGDSPEISVRMKNETLIYTSPSGPQTLDTLAMDEWVTVTVYDIDPSSDTFAVEWASPSGSGTQTGLDMANGMTDGYDNTIIQIDDAGYVDTFGIENDTTTRIVSGGAGWLYCWPP